MLKIRSVRFGQQMLGTLALVAVLAIALLLRLYRLGAHDLWYDEVFSVLYTDRPHAAWAPHLFFEILSFWVKTFGVSELSLRFLPMLFSFLTTGVVFLLGRELFNRKTALFSALLIALSPFHLWYAQEARDYGMLVFLGTLSSYVLCMALKKSDFKKWLAFVLLSVAGMRTNYFYHFLFAAQFLYVLYIFRFRLQKVFLAFLGVILIFCFFPPPRIFLVKFLIFSKGGLWIPMPDWQWMCIVLQDYMLGYNGTALLYTLSTCVVSASFIHLFFIARKKKDAQRSISFCVFLFMVPIVSIFLFSKLFFSVFLTRGMLLFSPYFYLLIAYSVMEWRRELRAAMAAILIGILTCGVYFYFKDHLYPPFEYHIGAYLKKPVKPIVHYLNDRAGKNDLIAATSESIMPGIDFYSQRKFQPYYLQSPWVEERGGMSRFMLASRVHLMVDEIIKYKFKRLWVIFTTWRRAGTFDPNSFLVKRYLNDHLKLISSHQMDGLEICGYERREPDRVAADPSEV